MYRELYTETQAWHLYTAAANVFTSMPPLGVLEATISRLAAAGQFPQPNETLVPYDFTAGNSPLDELADWYRRWPKDDWLAPAPCEITYDPDRNEFVVEGETPTFGRVWLARVGQPDGKWEITAFRIRDTWTRGSEVAFGRVLNMVLGTHPVPTQYEHETNRVLVRINVSGSHAFLERATPVALVRFNGEERAFEVCGIRVKLV